MLKEMLCVCFEQICPEIIREAAHPGQSFQSIVDKLKERYPDDKDVTDLLMVINRINQLDDKTLIKFCMEFERELLHSIMTQEMA